MAKKTRLGPEKMTIMEWEDCFTFYFENVLGLPGWYTSAVIESAHEVEGGYCYYDVMEPHLNLVLGEKYVNLVAFS